MPTSPNELLDQLFGRDPATGISLAVVAVQGGGVVAERYGVQPANPFQDELVIDVDTALLSWSMAKSITHAAVGILVDEGRLDVASPAPIGEWRGTPKEAITLDHLLEMRPGLAFTAHDDDTGFDHGRHWWRRPTFPGSYSCNGYEGRYTLVVPDRDLVVVHLGKTATAHQRDLTMHLARLVENL